MYQRYLDKMVQFTSSERFREELVVAKGEYFRIIGKLYEEDQSLEVRMGMFFNWFIFDRELTNERLTPAELFYRDNYASLNDEEKRAYESFKKTHHSLFYIKKVVQKHNLVRLLDVFDKKVYNVVDRRKNSGFRKKDLFESWLVKIGEDYYFIGSFCFHPPEIYSTVKKLIKKKKEWTKDEKFNFIQHLSYMKLKLERYKNIEFEKIYDFKGINYYLLT